MPPDPHDRAYEVRSFSQLCQVVNQGDDLAEIDADLRRVVSQITDNVAKYGGAHKGEITVKLTLTADNKGVDVQITASTKTPGRPVTKDRFFVTDSGDTLTLRNPNKGTLFEGSDLGRATRG
jgi:signal transduction histidine kinase